MCHVNCVMVMLVLLCVTGCQTTSMSGSSNSMERTLAGRDEKLLLRIEKIVGTYDVTVQRVVFMGDDPTDNEQWTVCASASVSGYPGTFRTSEEAQSPAASDRVAVFLLDGESVKVSQESGIHLTIKVIPEMQNTARVVGVFVHASPVGQSLETFSMPFDISCNLGEVVQLYEKKIPVAKRVALENIHDLMQ